MSLLLVIILLYFIYSLNKKVTEKDEEIKKLKRIIYNLKTKLDLMEGKSPEEDEEKLAYEEPAVEKETVKEEAKAPKENVISTMICSKCGKEVTKRSVSYCTECEEAIKREQDELEVKRKRLEEEKAAKRAEEGRTSLFLITGSILIILAAVVFLATGWQYIPDIVKTCILALGIVLFLGGSKIAKEKLNIPKTGKTFFYIAMAYIPIFLLSLSVFGLLGETLSIRGEGKYLYLGVSGIITSIVYYIAYKNDNGRGLFYGSLIAQLGSVMLITLMFAEDEKLVMLNLALYNLLLIMFLSKSDNPLLFKGIFSIIPFFVGFFSIFCFGLRYVTIPFIYLVLAANFILLYIKNKEDKVLPVFVVISIFMAGLHTIMIELMPEQENQIVNALALAFSFITFIVLMLLANNKKTFTNATAIVSFIAVLLLGFSQDGMPKDAMIPYFVYGIVEFLIAIMSYKLVTKTVKDLLDFVIPGTVIATGLLALYNYEATYHFYVFFSLFVFMIGEILPFDKETNIKKIWFTIGHAFILLTYMGAYANKPDEFRNDVIYFILLMFVYGYSYFRKANILFKYLGYTTIIVMLQSLGNALDVENIVRIVFLIIPSVGMIAVESKLLELQDTFSPIYSNVLKVIIFFALSSLDTDISAVIAILYAVYLILMNRKNINTPRAYEDVIPIVGVVPVVLGSTSLQEDFIIGILSIAVVALTAYSIIQKKISIYTIASGAYLYLLTGYLDSAILVELLFVIWSFVLWYFMDEERYKDIFKVIGVCSLVALYNSIIVEIELNTYTLFNYAGYIVADLYLFRSVINKYYKDSEVLEAITLAILYIVPITNYSDEIDGMLFSVLIVTIMIISYFSRFGSTFLISTGALLFNAFLLTREFWFSLPWWFYLLVLGAFLVAFAGTNEARQNKGISITDKLKEFKSKIDGNGPNS